MKKFFEITQNNTGGSFDEDGTLCHRLIIEADSETEANIKGEDLGCYWNGVEDGMDCDCCGDRWYGSHEINLKSINEKGYEVKVYKDNSIRKVDKNPEGEWCAKYGSYTTIEEPEWKKASFGSELYEGKIVFENIEEYAQFLADEYGWTVPDTRIFYLDGTIKEIFKTDFSSVTFKNKKRLITERTI